MSKKPKKTKKPAEKKIINLALQGGGAHGAFTWGVLDRILEDERLQIVGISGTSAGAMNGTLVAYGLSDGGAERARELLEEFWKRTSRAALFSPLQPTPFDKMLGALNMDYSPGFVALDIFTRLFSPYQYNFLDLNPLRNIMEDMVDFDKIRGNCSIELFVNATSVKSGKIKVFSRKQMSIEVLMASACLPFLFKTVYIDGEPYWDGGYSGNPALYPLFYSTTAPDVVLVQINPVYIDDAPTGAAEIMDRVNEISFNESLMHEMRAIMFVKKLLNENRVSEERYTNAHIHLIGAEKLMDNIGVASKFNADWNFLQYLRQIGYQAASDWLDAHYEKIGHSSSIDIEEFYL